MMKLKDVFENKKVCIWGYGLEGKSTCKFIEENVSKTSITIVDDKEISGVDYKTQLTKDTCFDEFDLIMKSPGIVINQSSFPMDKLFSQSQLFLQFYKKQVIGFTGTKGKSTSSSLCYHVLKENFDSVFLVGNIGVPCFEIINELNENSKVVFEISCHQLEYAKDSPHIAVLLNLFEEHLDHYGTFEKYIQAKENIFTHQDGSDLAIINSDCVDQINKAKHCVSCSMDDKGQIYAIGNKCFTPKSSIEIDMDKVALLGHHNYYNIAIVYAIAHDLFKVSDEAFQKALASFKPLRHRLENIGIVDGVRYVDDSISTICASTIQAIESISDVDTVLIGGMDRNIDYQPLIAFLKKSSVKHIILMYATGRRISEEWIEHDERCIVVDDLKEAVRQAKKVATKGKTCLLSPAAASYGYFKNFEERGDVFRELVSQDEI